MKLNRSLLGLLLLSLLIFVVCAEPDQKAEDTEIVWMTDLGNALEKASTENKPVMIDFMATWCPPCKAMEDSTFNQPEIIEKAGQFITLRIDVDKQPEVAKTYKSNAQKYGGIGIPNILFLSPDQKEIAHPIGYLSPERMTVIMDSVLQSL
jgi:thiol:disulfide interchange protein DsbD